LPNDFFIENQTKKETEQPVKPIEKKVSEEEVDKILKEEFIKINKNKWLNQAF
jgi:hypothetical protein